MAKFQSFTSAGCFLVVFFTLSCSSDSEGPGDDTATSDKSTGSANVNAANVATGDSGSPSSSAASAGGASGATDATSSSTSATVSGETANAATSGTSSAGTTTAAGGTDGTSYSEVFSGGEFHLGPVDWTESEWANSCSPYPEAIQQIEGNFLAGLELTHNGGGQLCDACVEIVADTGKSIVARVITTGVTTPNSIDLSPEAFAALDSGEYPRSMSWQVVKCPDTGNLFYQFQTEANVWWTSLWVRNARVPIEKVEVQSANHGGWFALTRASDGTYTDASGFGEGPFTLRITGVDGQTVEDSFDAFTPGELVESTSNFR